VFLTERMEAMIAHELQLTVATAAQECDALVATGIMLAGGYL
jgi:hypothetical protein